MQASYSKPLKDGGGPNPFVAKQEIEKLRGAYDGEKYSRLRDYHDQRRRVGVSTPVFGWVGPNARQQGHKHLPNRAMKLRDREKQQAIGAIVKPELITAQESSDQKFVAVTGKIIYQV